MAGLDGARYEEGEAAVLSMMRLAGGRDCARGADSRDGPFCRARGGAEVNRGSARGWMGCQAPRAHRKRETQKGFSSFERAYAGDASPAV
jgi:hypothetical protein